MVTAPTVTQTVATPEATQIFVTLRGDAGNDRALPTPTGGLTRHRPDGGTGNGHPSR
ncbi:hypothetical protein [Haloarchaeobius sp. DFWS5]|uniref:hypothetical protein n=1 Tax=Haloarchaeobius sp. DFWS5 TaxID=3446114 RepID=UPI003EBD8699